MKKYLYELEKQSSQRNTDTSPVKEVVSELLDKYKLKKKFKEIHIQEAWMQILGESVARRTLKLSVFQEKMFVRLESASLKNELMMAKSQIIEKLNTHVGEQVIEELIFL